MRIIQEEYISRQEMWLLARIITRPLVTLFARVKRLIEEAEENAKWKITISMYKVKKKFTIHTNYIWKKRHVKTEHLSKSEKDSPPF